MEDNFYKRQNRKMFYDQLPGVYTPQIEDEVYFIFQAYEEVVGYYMNHFFTLEENRSKPINDYVEKFLSIKLTDKNILTHTPLRCKITDITYKLPSATTIHVNSKNNLENKDFVIESELVLKVLEPEDLEGMEFSVVYFNHSSLEQSVSMNYIVPAHEFMQSITEEELTEINGHTCTPFNMDGQPLEMLEVTDFEQEIYPNCNFKCVFFKQVSTANSEGVRLRTNALGRSRTLTIGRLSIWDIRRASATSTPIKDNPVKNYIENRGFRPENYISVFNEIESGKLIETIEAFIRNNGFAESFVDIITDDITPDYLNIIPVEMNLNAIKYHLETGHYRSKEMLLKDLKLIEDNCIEFNGSEEALSKNAKNVHENLKKVFIKTFSYKLRNVSSLSHLQVPRRTSSIKSSEPENLQKRNPRKVTNTRKRSTRQRNSVDYKEDSEEEKTFKKPTPQKNKRMMLSEDSEISAEEQNFKISLEPEPELNLRRSSRSRNAVILKGIY